MKIKQEEDDLGELLHIVQTESQHITSVRIRSKTRKLGKATLSGGGSSKFVWSFNGQSLTMMYADKLPIGYITWKLASPQNLEQILNMRTGQITERLPL